MALRETDREPLVENVRDRVAVGDVDTDIDNEIESVCGSCFVTDVSVTVEDGRERDRVGELVCELLIE